MKKQIGKNIGANIVSFICNILIGLMLTPYLVNSLGVIAYGLIPLAMIFTDYINIITQSITSSINRHLTIALERNDRSEVLTIFSTAVYVMLIVVIIQWALSLILVNHLEQIIKIPVDIITDAKLLFALTFTNFSLSLISAVMSVSMYAKNRLDIIQWTQILRVLIRVLFILVLFNCYEVSLFSVGIGSLISGVIVFFVIYYKHNRLAPEIHCSIKYFKGSKVRDIASFGSWILINQVGFLLLAKIDLLILNKYVSVYDAGIYSALTQLTSVVKSFALVFSGVTGPIIMIYYANNELDKIISITKIFVTFLSISISVLVGVIFVNAGLLLEYWLGSEFVEYDLVLGLLMLTLAFSLGMQPLFSVNTAFNKVKIPAIASLIFGLFGLVVSLILATKTGLGIYSVIIGSIISLTIKNTLFTPMYTAYCLQVASSTFLFMQFKSLAMLLVTFVFSSVLGRVFQVDNIFDLVFLMCFEFLAMFIASYFLYSKNEKKAILKILLGKFNKNEENN